MQVYNWIKTVGEDFLDNNRVMGDSVKTSQDFVYAHRELDSEKQVVLKCWKLLSLKLLEMKQYCLKIS